MDIVNLTIIAMAIIIVILAIMLWILNYRLLSSIEKFAKLLKADNLQEYIMEEWKPEEKIDIWQTEKRFKDVSDISEEDLKNLKINPDSIYSWFTWNKTKTEKFTS